MRKKRTLNLQKAARASILINTLQVLAVLVLAGYIFSQYNGLSRLEIFGLWAIALVVIWGGVVDIRDAFSALRAARESDMLEDALSQLETLNLTLRKQRHDFLNHLQVVFGLIELEQTGEARAYIERIYGDVQSVGRGMKTALPALNALLAAKMAECEKKGIAAQFDIRSDWHDMPIPAWELCRVLSNLIDNAVDALEGVQAPCLTVYMGESVSEFSFYVEDNGTGLPEGLHEHIYLPGFTTKHTGHGMGLSIVREILSSAGGQIHAETVSGKTRFSGSVPKKAQGA